MTTKQADIVSQILPRARSRGAAFMRRIPLSQGKFAIVDDQDYRYLMQWKWSYSECARSGPDIGCAQRTVHLTGKSTTILMHRLILNRKLGRRSARQVNHRNGNKLDNRRRNLREATASQNCHNRKKRPNCTSRYIGVSFWSSNGKWAAEIFAFSRRVFIGFFPNEERAARAYNDAAVKYYGEYANLNSFRKGVKNANAEVGARSGRRR